MSVVEPDSPKYRVPKIEKSERFSEALQQEIQKLQEENKQLQLRILGVNELARLLQDRNEIVQVLQEKNKRLEVAVVRLENRCSNFERKLKSQGGVVVGPKPGQSPFIPGPSRQILEALMKENSELKKTLNKKVPVGYLEAVKTTQLEEVIDQQKQEVDFLKTQIHSLTSSSLSEEERSSGESSLSSVGSMADTGPLKRQLIKLQHAMRVKDRFCTLLSEQVADLQHKLSTAPKETSDDFPSMTSNVSSTSSGQPVQESITDPEEAKLPSVPEPTMTDLPPTHQQIRELKDQLINQKEELEGRYKHLIDDQKKTIQRERDERESLVDKLQSTEQQLKRSKTEHDSLQHSYEDLLSYNHTLVEEKTHLTRMLSASQQKPESSHGRDASEETEQSIRVLERTMEDQVSRHSEEMQMKDKEISQLKTVMEDTHFRLAIAESKLETAENEKLQAVSNLQDQIDESDMEVNALRNEKQELMRENREKSVLLGHYKANAALRPAGYPGSGYRSTMGYSASPNTVGGHCAPILHLAGHQGMMEAVADRPRPRPSTGPQQSASYMDPTMTGRAYTAQHCLPSQVEYLAHRQEVPAGLAGRGVPDKPPGRLDLTVPHQSPQQQHRRTPPPTHMVTMGTPMMMGQTPTTPLDPHQINRGLSPGPQESRSISPTTHSTAASSRHSPHHQRGQYPVVTTTTPSQTHASQPFAPVPQTYSGEVRRATYPTVSHHPGLQTSGYTVMSTHPPQPAPQTPYHSQGSRESGYSSINSEGYSSGRLQSQLSPSYDPHHLQRMYNQGAHGQDESSSSSAAKEYYQPQ